jgi:hypothetical protein
MIPNVGCSKVTHQRIMQEACNTPHSTRAPVTVLNGAAYEQGHLQKANTAGIHSPAAWRSI